MCCAKIYLSITKMIVLDMDETILKKRFINECADSFGFGPRLEELRFSEKDPIILTKRIGLLLKTGQWMNCSIL